MNQFSFKQRLMIGLVVLVAAGLASISALPGKAQASSAPPAPGTTNDTPRSGNVSTIYYFSAPLYPDPDGNWVQAVFDWGDGSPNYTSALANFPSGYSGSMSFDASHYWNTAGTYYIKVKAVDSTGLSSSWTSFVTMTIGSPPNQPTLTATVSGNSVSLSWTESSSNVSGFKIYRQNPDGSVMAPGPGDWSSTVRSYTDLNVPIGTYYYYMQAYSNPMFLSSNSNMAMITVSVSETVPASPSSLFVSGSSPTSIGIYWADNSTNESEFKIERRFNSGSWSQVGSVVGNGTTKATTNVNTFYTDSSLSGAGTYDYRVTACNSAGCSGYSSITSQVIDAAAPAAPSGLTATYSSTAGSVAVSWTDNSTGEWGFRLFRRVHGNTSWFGLASVFNNSTGNSVSFNDTYQLAVNTTYDYVVRSYNTYESADSNIVTVTTGNTSSGDTTPPSVPANVSATALSSSSIQISWAASTDNVAVSNYKIYRGGTQISWTSSLSYTDTSLSPGTTYTYTVAVVDTSNNLSAQSATVSATTQSVSGATSPTSCGSVTSGGGIKTGIYLIHGYNSEIYGRTDCVADSEQQIQWVTCVEALSGTMFYPQRDNFSYSYTVKNSSGTTIDSGNWTPSYLTSMSSCPSNNGSGSAYTVNYNLTGLQPGTPYTFTVSGINAGGTFSSTAVFRTKSSALIPTTAATSTTSTPTQSSAPAPTSTPSSGAASAPVSIPAPTYKLCPDGKSVLSDVVCPKPVVYVSCPDGTKVPEGIICPVKTEDQMTVCLNKNGKWCLNKEGGTGYCVSQGDCRPVVIDRGVPTVETPAPLDQKQTKLVEAKKKEYSRSLDTLEKTIKRFNDQESLAKIAALREKLSTLPADDSALDSLATIKDDILTLRDVKNNLIEQNGNADLSERDIAMQAKALKQLKQGMVQFARQLDRIEAKANRLEKQGFTVPAALRELINQGRAFSSKIKDTKEFEVARDMGEALAGLSEDLNLWIPRLEQLARVSQLSKVIQNEINKREAEYNRVQALVKRLKVDLEAYMGDIRTKLDSVKEANSQLNTKEWGEEEPFDFVQESIIDKLADADEAMVNVRELANLRAAVNKLKARISKYDARIVRLVKQKKDVTELSDLVEKLKDTYGQLKELSSANLVDLDLANVVEKLGSADNLVEQLDDLLKISAPSSLEKALKGGLKVEKIQTPEIEKQVIRAYRVATFFRRAPQQMAEYFSSSAKSVTVNKWRNRLAIDE